MSGPQLCSVWQKMLLIWNRVIRRKWKSERSEGINGLAHIGFEET